MLWNERDPSESAFHPPFRFCSPRRRRLLLDMQTWPLHIFICTSHFLVTFWIKAKNHSISPSFLWELMSSHEGAAFVFVWEHDTSDLVSVEAGKGPGTCTGCLKFQEQSN